MRCGLACAKTVGAKPAAATPAAAAPATNWRRLIPLALSGAMQQLQEAARLRPFHLSMMSSRFPGSAADDECGTFAPSPRGVKRWNVSGGFQARDQPQRVVAIDRLHVDEIEEPAQAPHVILAG